MSEATLGELLFGAEKSQNKTKNLQIMAILKNVVLPLPVDQEVWGIFAQMKAELQKLGKPIDDMDLIIRSQLKGKIGSRLKSLINNKTTRITCKQG